jgi:hypothetical protein
MNRPVYAGNEPLSTERYVQWCEKTGVNHPLLLDGTTISAIHRSRGRRCITSLMTAHGYSAPSALAPAPWALAPRDRFIGWTRTERERH